METVIFKKYEDGNFTFEFERGEDMVFEEIHPKILNQYDLKNDTSLIGKTFQLHFSEQFEDYEENLVIYRVESLKLT